MKADTAALETNYADDAVIIRRTGLMSTKAQDIEALKSGAVKFDILDDREENLRIYGNVAVVNVVARAKGLIASQPIDSDFRETRIWVKQKGNWKLVVPGNPSGIAAISSVVRQTASQCGPSLLTWPSSWLGQTPGGMHDRNWRAIW